MLYMMKASEGDGFTDVICSVLFMLQSLDQIFQLYYKQSSHVSFSALHNLINDLICRNVLERLMRCVFH